MKCKILGIITILILSASVSFGQILKMKSTAVSSKFKGDYNWGEWKETSVLITLDLQKERITIYSSEKQVYDIAENEGKSFDEDGDETLSLYCVDKDGLTCRVRIVTLHSQDEQLQLYVHYNDMAWVYNVYLLD